MGRMKKRRRVAWLVALAVGLMLVPAVDATAATRSAVREQAQNHRITKLIKQTATIAQKVANLTGNVGKQVQALADVQTQVTGIDTRLKAIEAAAPVLVDNLTKLGAAAQQLKDGLTTVGAGLTTVGAGLTKLGAAYQAVEYGRAGIFLGGSSVVAGGAVTSADIPDDGNAITSTEDAIITAGATTTTIDLRAAIRSAESDGDSAAKTAGQAGGFVQVSDLQTGASVPCAGSPPGAGGIFGTQPGDSIVTPSGTVTNLPLKNIPGGNLRTDTTHPDATSTNLLPASCSITTVSGSSYRVHYSVNFLDIPTSTTPGPTE
jgi:hypothetical protein